MTPKKAVREFRASRVNFLLTLEDAIRTVAAVNSPPTSGNFL